MVSRPITSGELTRLTGIKFRQLDHWTRLGILEPILPPTGPGHPRRWDETEVEIVRAVMAAREAGQDLDRCRVLAAAVRSGHEAVAPALEGLLAFQRGLRLIEESAHAD